MCHYESELLHSALSRPSCSAAITGEITTTHSRGRVAPFSLSPVAMRESKAVLSPAAWEGWCYPPSALSRLPALFADERDPRVRDWSGGAPIAPVPVDPTLGVSGIMKMSRRFEAVSPRGKRASGQRRRSACTQDNLVFHCRKSVITN